MEAALHNTMGAVMVGGIIYVTLPDGEQWVFCDCQRYELWAADPENHQHDPNDPCVEHSVKQVFYGPNGEACSDYANQRHWNACNNRRNMRVKAFLKYIAGVGTETGAQLDSWRQRSNGRWQRKYLKLRTTITGQTRTLECTFRGGVNKVRERWSRSLDVGVLYEGQRRTFRIDDLRGEFWWQGNHTDEINLDWTQPSCWN